MKNISFVCVHNSCRSQIAEAFARIILKDKYNSFSAGTEKKSQINQQAVRLMKKLYGIDMEINQYSKTLDEIPKTDILITMGCNIVCPIVPNEYSEDWGIDDPTGKNDEDFIHAIETIRHKVLQLLAI